MNKAAYIDIGELGWSLCLSAHIRWLKENTDHSIVVYTSPDRRCLYKGLAGLILGIPFDFYRKFREEQEYLGLHHTAGIELREYFQNILPSDHVIPKDFGFDRNFGFLSNKVIYKPYEYSKKLEGKKRILIFPRYRTAPVFSRRNLTKSFYVELIKTLCDEFSSNEIKTLGLDSGSHSIMDDEIGRSNYTNGVEAIFDLQDMIDECQIAICAIGGTSAPPKISLLQGVPTFIIGHEKRRFKERDNWMGTKVDFYEIGKGKYEKINTDDCIQTVIAFVKEIQ